MASVQGEIDRIATAKSDIESAIEYCGVDVPNTALISTYADYIRAIPTTIFSQLNYNSVGGTDEYIESISQSNGVISTTTGTTATASKSGLMSKADKVKLDGITEGADSVSFSQNLTTGVKVGSITISGTTTDLYCSNTWEEMSGATDSADGTAGYVPKPTAGKQNSFLKGNGTWDTITTDSSGSHTHVFTGAAHNHTFTGNKVNSSIAGRHTPEGTNSEAGGHIPSGTISSSGSYTPDGTVTLNGSEASGVLTITATFSGSAVPEHSHTFTGDVIADHTHAFTGTVVSGHTHEVIATGSINDVTVEGTIEVAGSHTHNCG